MILDNKAMLDRVISEVFNEDFVIMRVSSDDAHGSYSVRVNSHYRKDRSAIIRADYTWMDAFIPELDVHAGILVVDTEEDDDDEDAIEAYREGELKRICRLIHAYLEGKGRVSERRSLLGRGPVRKLVIESDGFEWRLGRNQWSGPGPV